MRFRKVKLWRRFSRALSLHTHAGWCEAAHQVGEMLAYGMDLAREAVTCAPLFGWARGVLDDRGSTAWPSEAIRSSMTHQLWPLIRPMAAHHINRLGPPSAGGTRGTPLHLAVGFGSRDATALLLSCPALDVNATNLPHLETVFHHAFRYQSPHSEEAATEVLESRILQVDFDARNSDGKTVDDLIAAGTDDFLVDAWALAKRWTRDTLLPHIGTSLAAHFPHDLAAVVLGYLTPRALLLPMSAPLARSP
jgi:hypothetical protein